MLGQITAVIGPVSFQVNLTDGRLTIYEEDIMISCLEQPL